MTKIGIAFPFMADGRGSIEYSNNLQKSIEDSIKQIISTKKKERPMNLEFGCDIWKLTFDHDLLLIKELASEYVKESLFKWETRIEVYEVNITKNEETIYVDVIYKIKNTNIEQSLVRVELTIGGI